MNENSNNLIYGLFCPVTNNPVYIGKSSSGIKRPFQHIIEDSHNDNVNLWVHNLKEDGLSPVLVILEQGFDLMYSRDKEDFWIKKYISDGNLLLNIQGVSPLVFTLMSVINPPKKMGIICMTLGN